MNFWVFYLAYVLRKLKNSSKINSRYEMSRNENDSVFRRDKIISRYVLNYKFSRWESYTYTSAWKTGILLTELSSETKINAPLLQIHHVCCCRMSRMHREARKIWRQLHSLPSEFLFPANRTWNCANIVTSSNSCAMRSYFSTTVGTSCVASFIVINISNRE